MGAHKNNNNNTMPMFTRLNKTTQKTWMLQEANSMGKGKRVTFSNKCILA
jgi:hypothetical protein